MFNSFNKLCVVAVPSVLLLTGCIGGVKQPEWITKPSEQYSPSQYLVASGSADQQNAADSRALANLSRIFEVAIEDSAMDFSEATVSSQGDVRQVKNEQRAARSVNTFANQVLEGAKVVEHWKGESGPHYSLAVLEKAPAARRLREKIRDMDKQTDSLRNYASNQAGSPSTALSALEKARLLQVDRAQLNRNLSVVTGSGLPARNSAASLETQIREALAVLRFDIDANPVELYTGLQGAINSLGAQYFERSAYIIEGKLDTEPLQRKQGWYWLRGSLELSLVRNGEVQAKQRWPLKVSATDKGMVKQRANDHLAGKLPNYVYQLLTSDKVSVD